ncbi:hypothetical protein, partial [Staphylococcus aureus]
PQDQYDDLHAQAEEAWARANDMESPTAERLAAGKEYGAIKKKMFDLAQSDSSVVQKPVAGNEVIPTDQDIKDKVAKLDGTAPGLQITDLPEAMQGMSDAEFQKYLED